MVKQCLTPPTKPSSRAQLQQEQESLLDPVTREIAVDRAVLAWLEVTPTA